MYFRIHHRTGVIILIDFDRRPAAPRELVLNLALAPCILPMRKENTRTAGCERVPKLLATALAGGLIIAVMGAVFVSFAVLLGARGAMAIRFALVFIRG